MENTEKLAQMIKSAKNIVVFTGAGISCPSGIPDFRSADGLYNDKGYNYPPEEIISHSFFLRNTEMFYEFYRSKMLYPDAQPNDAHKFFAHLEKLGKNVTVVTQNIDGLHQLGGSSDVVELHGSVHRNYCMNCGKFYNLQDIAKLENVPRCSCGGIIKPDVVLYEESLNEGDIERAVDKIGSADLLIVVGTSLVVYPAASFLQFFRGNNLVLINKSATSYDSKADLTFNCDVIDVVKELKALL